MGFRLIYINPDGIAQNGFGDWNSEDAVWNNESSRERLLSILYDVVVLCDFTNFTFHIYGKKI